MKTLCFAVPLLLLVLLLPGAISRPCPNGYSELISDGMDAFREENGISSSNPIRLKGMDAGEEKCEQMYGFLPCSYTIPGHLFLILAYEFLLFHAESYVDSGGKRIFKILGPGVFGASAFQIIGSLPEALILLASGLSSSSENAQEYVLTGVGLLAGSSVLLLTVIWGTCIIIGSQNFSSRLQSNPPENEEYNRLEILLLSRLPGYGVVTEPATSYISRIMLLSVIPLTMIQFIRVLNLSGERIFVLIILVVAIIFLLCYFVYQFFDPWIQKWRLQYIKHEHLVVDILKHVQDKTVGRLLNENGSPKVSAIRRLFRDWDRDGDKVISLSELKESLKEIRIGKRKGDEDKITEEVMSMFDGDEDEKITMDEFVNGMIKWLDDTKDAMNKRFHSVKSLKDLYQVLQPWIEKKREEREVMKTLIPDILNYFQNSLYGSLLTEDGFPDVPAIKRLFKDIDLDNDDYISYPELKELMTKIKFGIIPYDAGEAAARILKALDVSRDKLISEEEFVSGLSEWLNTAYNQSHRSEESEADNYQKSWEQTDKLLEDNDKSPSAWAKAIAFVLVGIVMLGLLAEPLVQSVRNFSAAANVPSFYVAFVFVPLATNARFAISAINETRRKTPHITSLTLSEIYGTVFMNNILGLAVLLSLIYFRRMAWEFSAEVLIVVIVSAIIGCFASFNRVYPVWTSILAYLMYPLSLLLVYILGDFSWLS